MDSDEGDEFPILEAIRLHVRAHSHSSAMEKAVIATTNTLDEDEIEHYTISVIGVFAGALDDLANSYEPTDEFIADIDNIDAEVDNLP
jgi:spore coat polysaccharide biosynthesis protein SpsF (cytidylyltransferase family)